MNERYQCDNCEWNGPEDELETRCTYWGTREQPPEYDSFCPSCGDSWENMQEVPWCLGCEDVHVKHEGDYCPECTEAAREDRYDAMKEDRLMEDR